LDEYREELERRLGKAHEVMRIMIHKAQRDPKRIVFPEGEEPKILRASQILLDDKIAKPILLGDAAVIKRMATEMHLHVEQAMIVDPATSEDRKRYADELFRLRQRKGLTRMDADAQILSPNTFGSMMVLQGDADALIGGVTLHYPGTIRPALQVIPVAEGLRKVSGVYLLVTQRGDLFFLADATVNIDPSSEDLVEIAISAASVARRFDVEPRVALLSFSNFGSTRHPLTEKVRRAVEILKAKAPDLVVDGEMQADTAVVPEILEHTYPFSTLKRGANVLVFPSLEAGNIAYKLLARIGGAETIGPVLVGLSKPVHVLQRAAEVNDIVNMAAIAVVDAQMSVPTKTADMLPEPQRLRADQD
jgi:malate dehydrogenase (oxaloacetate-decarboxylating)(NADP+)